VLILMVDSDEGDGVERRLGQLAYGNGATIVARPVGGKSLNKWQTSVGGIEGEGGNHIGIFDCKRSNGGRASGGFLLLIEKRFITGTRVDGVRVLDRDR